MSCLYLLPSDLTVWILSKWCDFESIIKIDSATTNYLERGHLLSGFESNGFVINNKFNDHCYCNLHLPHKLDAMEWIDSKQLKLSTVMFSNYSNMCPIASELLFGMNVNFITEISFSLLPKLSGSSTYGAAMRNQFLSRAVQFINGCKQLKALSIRHQQHNNQLIVGINPSILNQLEMLQWSSCSNLYRATPTISVLMDYCRSLTVLHLIYLRQPFKYERITEADIIKLIINNTKLTSIKFICVPATELLFDAIFEHCKAIQSLTVYTNETHGKSQLSFQSINKFMCQSTNASSVFLIINGYAFGQLQHKRSKKTKRHMYFKSLIVSKKVFHDLTLLSHTPILKRVNFDDCLLYFEDQFVLCVNNSNLVYIN